MGQCAVQIHCPGTMDRLIFLAILSLQYFLQICCPDSILSKLLQQLGLITLASAAPSHIVFLFCWLQGIFSSGSTKHMYELYRHVHCDELIN